MARSDLSARLSDDERLRVSFGSVSHANVAIIFFSDFFLALVMYRPWLRRSVVEGLLTSDSVFLAEISKNPGEIRMCTPDLVSGVLGDIAEVDGFFGHSEFGD